MKIQEIGRAALNFTQLDVKFWHGVVRATTFTFDAGPFLCFLFFLEKQNSEKYENSHTTFPKKKKKKWSRFHEFCTCVANTELILQIEISTHVQNSWNLDHVANTELILQIEISKLSAEWQKCNFSRYFLFYVLNRILGTSFDGKRIRQCHLHRSSRCVLSPVCTNFH